MKFHKNEPREVGYAKEHEEYYQANNPDISLTHKDSNSIFAGLSQKDLFIFATAIGKYNNCTKTPKDLKKNVVVTAMDEKQKWALLAVDLSNNKEILRLSDEKQCYSTAEKYACAGMDIIIEEIAENGYFEYANKLEKELKEILIE